MDKSGRVVVPPRANSAFWNFVQGKALVVSEGVFSVIDRDWKTVSVLKVCDIPYFYHFPQDWNAVRCLVKVGSDNFLRAHINWKGEFSFPPMYAELGAFVNGVAPFAPNDQLGPWGLVRANGEVILPPNYYSIGHFAEGLAPAALEKKKFGYINASGEWVIPPIYQGSSSFHDGLACVIVPGKHRHGNKGFINPAGEMVIEPRFFRQSSFRNGWALVERDGMQQVIDRTGGVLWEAPIVPL